MEVNRIEEEKSKLIQKQLIVLKKAKSCYNSASCLMPNCDVMKQVIVNMRQCQEGIYCTIIRFMI